LEYQAIEPGLQPIGLLLGSLKPLRPLEAF
jgi:hypothetical protein